MGLKNWWNTIDFMTQTVEMKNLIKQENTKLLIYRVITFISKAFKEFNLILFHI